jgi:hypothetical protein
VSITLIWAIAILLNLTCDSGTRHQGKHAMFAAEVHWLTLKAPVATLTLNDRSPLNPEVYSRRLQVVNKARARTGPYRRNRNGASSKVLLDSRAIENGATTAGGLQAILQTRKKSRH